MDYNNCPVGTDTKDAPWHESTFPEKEIEVLISVTLSKSVKIKVSDYTIIEEGKDEDGIPYENIDYSNCNLHKAVLNQIRLPHKAWESISPFNPIGKQVREDLKNWDVDDLEIIIQ